MSSVLFEPDGRIGRDTLNRPDVLNAIDGDMPEALAAAIRAANDHPDVRVIVLSGAGRAFCAGYDLDYYAQAAEGAGAEITQPTTLPTITEFVGLPSAMMGAL